MAMKKRAGKKTTAKKTRKTAAKKSTTMRKNDPLRKKLEGVLKAIEQARLSPQDFPQVRAARDALEAAIQELKDKPGPSQDIGG
jgi:hypothetical protein